MTPSHLGYHVFGTQIPEEWYSHLNHPPHKLKLEFIKRRKRKDLKVVNVDFQVTHLGCL